MADDVDRAKIAEMRFRADAIEHERAKAREIEDQLIIDGVVLCLDCGAPIDPLRLAVRPQSVRCIDCKTLKEERERLRG